MEQQKVSFMSSIQSRIIMLVICTILFDTTLVMALTSPRIVKGFLRIQGNYMKDMAIAYGEMLDEKVEEEGLEVIGTPAVREMLSSVHINDDEGSYIYVVALDGTMLYHPTEEKIGEPVENAVVKEILAEIEAGNPQEPAVHEYEYHGATKFAGVFPEEDCGFVLVITSDKKVVNKEYRTIVVMMVQVAVLAMILGVVISIVFSKIIVQPLKSMSEITNRFSTLDLRKDERQSRIDGRKDEVGLMGRSLVELRNQFEEVVTYIKAQSNHLYAAATSLDEHTRESANNLEQVEKAVYEIAEGASSQAEETQNATTNVIHMGKMVEETNGEVVNLFEYANAMKASGDEASRSLKELDAINDKAKESIDLIYRQTNNTNESALKIREATELITFIAEQTNLLSLNASIEAARAGEQGRGFAVVASQIQKLAEQSNDSARQIGEIITLLIEDSNEAVDTMKEVKIIMEEQNRNIHQIEVLFEQLYEQIDMSMKGVGNISDKTLILDKARVNVVDIVQNLTAIAEENAASTEETSASVSEVSEIVKQISESVQELKSIAEDLDSQVGRFTVE